MAANLFTLNLADPNALLSGDMPAGRCYLWWMERAVLYEPCAASGLLISCGFRQRRSQDSRK